MNIVADWSIESVEQASSSSDLARAAAEQGAPTGTGFLVARQTAGRGRRGSRWESPQGGMYYSVLLRPTLPMAEWFGFSFLACLAIRDVIAEYLPDQTVGLKWPNDVVVVGHGKICGILIEITGQNMILGTGVNVASVATPAGAKLPATALQDFGIVNITPHDLAKSYRDELAKRYDAYRAQGFASIREEWLSHCMHVGMPLAVQLNDQRISGRFQDLAMDGTLQLVSDNGDVHRISTGDIELMGRI